MVSVYLSVCLSLAGDARGLWGERRATTKALNPSHYTTILLLAAHCCWNMDLSQRLWLINESGLFQLAGYVNAAVGFLLLVIA